MRLNVSTWGLHPQWVRGKKAPSESAGRLREYVPLTCFSSFGGTLRLPRDSQALSAALRTRSDVQKKHPHCSTLKDTCCNPLKVTADNQRLAGKPASVAVMSHRTVFHAGEGQARGPVSVSFPVIGRGSVSVFPESGDCHRRHPIVLRGRGMAPQDRPGPRQVRSAHQCTPATCLRHLPTSSALLESVVGLHLDGYGYGYGGLEPEVELSVPRRSFRLQSVNQHARMRRLNLRCFIRNTVPEHWASVHRQAKGCNESAQKGMCQFLRHNPFSAQPGPGTRTRDSGAPPHLRRREARHRPESLIYDLRSVRAARPPQ